MPRPLTHGPLRRFARTMRSEATPAERKLWWLLQARRSSGYKIRRQAPLGPYILDFVCFERRLVIEAVNRSMPKVGPTPSVTLGWPTKDFAFAASGMPT